MREPERLARLVNLILIRYIAVQNEVFPGPLCALSRILGLHKPIDFGALEQRLETLQMEVTAARDAVGKVAVPQDIPAAETDFMVALQRYCGALCETMDLLRLICVGLRKKSVVRRHYPWNRYRKDLRSYESAVRHYRRLGVELNEIFARVPQSGQLVHYLYTESRALLSRKDFAHAYDLCSDALDQIAELTLPAELNGINYEEQLRTVRMFAAFGHFRGTSAREMVGRDADWVLANAKDKQARKLASRFIQVDAQRDHLTETILRDLEGHPDGGKMAEELRRLGEDVLRDKS